MPRNSSGTYTQPASDLNPPVSLTPIDSAAFAAAMTDISNELTNSLDRLGRGPMQANLSMGGFVVRGSGPPVLPTDVARLSDIASYLPAGVILPYGALVAPLGWLLCDGTAYSRATFSALFLAIGTAWGVGDGSTTFNVPDFRGSFLRGLDSGKGNDPSRVFATFQADMFAAHKHTHNPHNHAITDPGHNHFYNGSQQVNAAGGVNSVGNTVGQQTGNQFTFITINNTTTTEQNTGGTETAPKNWAMPFIIRT